MLNLPESLSLTIPYNFQRDLYLKILLSSFGCFSFLDFLRSQVSEVNILQLVPGYVLILLIISFIILVASGNFLFRIPTELDGKRKIGVKFISKFNIFLLMRSSFLFFFGTFLFIIVSIIPLSLDFFNSSGEKTLENLWSFDEVLTIETILLYLLLFLSQFPILIIPFFSTEKDLGILPKFWRPLGLFLIILSGFITPTVDGFTQLNFAGSAFSFYLMIINFVEKRMNIKFTGFSSLSS